MRITKEILTIRSAVQEDAKQLNRWWNDGAVMAHAGFPNGLNQSLEETRKQIGENGTRLSQRCIIEADGSAIGELSYGIGSGEAEIGIKICETSSQERGKGTILLNMLIEFLFEDEEINKAQPIMKIILDTDLSNSRAQHVYEKIGFNRLRENKDCWKDQLGQLRTGVDYEMTRTYYERNKKNIIDGFYDKYQEKEDEYYRQIGQEAVTVPDKTGLGNQVLDEGIAWLCEGSQEILDFGCGNGSLLFQCGLQGTAYCRGMDFSGEGIRIARDCARLMNRGSYQFQEGSVEKLAVFETGSVDGMILSNIVDNMRPQDAEYLMEETLRILKPGGKLLVKLNPYITEEQVKEWKIQKLEHDLLDDGLLLWNQTDAQWEEFLERFVQRWEFRDVYFEEYDQHNRMYLCRM